MARALGLALALVLLVAPGAAGYAAPSGELLAGSEETVLRLHDLPPGYQIGDDSGCSPLSPPEGVFDRLTRRYSKWVVENRPEGCSYEYERVFEVPDLEPPAPPRVEAGTINTPSEEVAARGFKLLGASLTRSEQGVDGGTVSIPTSGAPARLFRSRDVPVEGESRPGSFLYWRQGKLIAAVSVAGMSPRSNDSAALHFAQIQQERLEHPSPYTEAERDDAEVWLDDPELKLPIYWAGRSFVPGQGLPAAGLVDAFPTDGGAGPPGSKFRLEYEGFSLDNWTRGSWKWLQRSKLGKLNRKERCTRTTGVELEQGRAIVFAGYGRLLPGACPRRAPDRYWAIARIGDMVIGVNLTICTLCLAGGEGPYNSVRGMKAIVRALVVRPKPVY